MKIYRTFCSSFIILNLVGCSMFSATDLHGERPYIESATTHNRPISEPVRAITSFSSSLSCMDNLLLQSGVGQTTVAVKTIKDASGKAAASANDMIVTSLSQMSRSSAAFRVVDFEVDPLKQDTVQTLTSLLLPTGSMQIPAPQIYISGSISYVDQNVLRKSNSAGASVNEEVEVGYSGDVGTTALGMELHVGDFLTRTLYPGIDSANEIVAASKGAGLDAGARIKKVGIQFSFERNLSQGVGAAVRTLVDLGMIELVGKLSQVPYWQCLSLDQSHPEFQRQLLTWYEDMGEKERIKFFQTGLKRAGYYQGQVNGKNSAAFREALALYQKDNNATPSGFVNFESYERLMRNYTNVDASGNFKKVGIAGNSSNNADIAITINTNKSSYSRGDILQLNVESSQDESYLSCFYQDVVNNIAQIYPNPLQSDTPLSRGSSLQIPGTNAFSLALTQKGRESVMCIASYSSLAAELQQHFGQPLNSINGVQSMEQMLAKLRALFGKEIKGEKTITYTVN